MTAKQNNFFLGKSLWVFLILLISCDFTSSTHKDILTAQQKFKEQKFEESAWYYERVLEKSLPNVVKTKVEYQLADIYSIYLKNYQSAIKHFDKVLEYAEEPLWKVRSLEKKATIYFNYLQKYEQAAKIYETLMSFRPKLKDYDEYEYLIARSMIKMNRYNDAIKIIDTMRKNENHEFYIRSFYDRGLVSFYKKEWDQAIKYWYQYIKREPNRDRVIEAKFMMANAYESNENLRRAYSLYSSIKDEYPNSKVIESRIKALYNRKVVRKR